MRHLLVSHNRRTRLCTRALERRLSAQHRLATVASWLFSALLLAASCGLFAYILAEAAFGAGSIVQFSSK